MCREAARNDAQDSKRSKVVHKRLRAFEYGFARTLTGAVTSVPKILLVVSRLAETGRQVHEELGTLLGERPAGKTVSARLNPLIALRHAVPVAEASCEGAAAETAAHHAGEEDEGAWKARGPVQQHRVDTHTCRSQEEGS